MSAPAAANHLASLSLSVEEKLGQLITVRIGSNLPPATTVDQDYQRVANLLGRCPVGGLVLFNGTWPTTPATLAELQSRSRVPLLIGSDIERGCGQQMRGLTVMPHAMAFGAVGKDDLTIAESEAYRFGRITGQQARLAGIQVAFAPVADTNTNPRNPIIATRAFGTDPTRVARLVAAFVRGCEEAGVAATAKHFPGHGDTYQDSHDSLPVVERDRAGIEATELPPFRSAIHAGCSLIMTAHVAYPGLDASRQPATLSGDIVNRLLSDELKFSGVVCSDSLLMAGVRERFDSEGELCLATLQAGVDLLLDVENPEAVLDYLTDAMATGRLDPARVNQAADRVLQLKRRLFTTPPKLPAAAEAESQAATLAERVALGAIQPVDTSAACPFSPSRPLTVVLAKPFATPLDPPSQPLHEALANQFVEVDYFELGPDASDADITRARQAAVASDQLLLAMIVKPAAWHRFGLLDYQQALLTQLVGLGDTVLVSLGVPSILQSFPDAKCRLCSFSDVEASQRALARYLAGGRSAPA